MNLTKQTIVSTAMGLLDSYGLADVSMRRIASVLKVQPSALYWHVESKQDLLSAMAHTMMEGLPSFPGGDLTRIPAWAARFHGLLTRYRNGGELLWSVLSLQDWDTSLGGQIQAGLLQAGIDESKTLGATRGLLHLILGHSFDDDQRNEAVRLGVVSTTWTQTTTTLDDAIEIFLAGLETLRC